MTGGPMVRIHLPPAENHQRTGPAAVGFDGALPPRSSGQAYASTYPLDVLGLILVDAYSERLETLLTPGRWSALVRFNVRSGSDTIEPIPSYGDLETIGFGKDNVMMRQATATTPLRGARCRLR